MPRSKSVSNKFRINPHLPIPLWLALLLLIFVVLLFSTIFVRWYSYDSKNQTSSVTEPKSKIYKSTILDFTIEAPEGFEVEEKFGSVKLNSSLGAILIARNSTNYSNLEDYLNDPKVENEAISNKKNLTINGMSSLVGFTSSGKVFFILVPKRVYSFSTQSNSLFLILDQIAQSFKYTPD